MGDEPRKVGTGQEPKTKTPGAIKAGAAWTREKWLVADIRTRLHSDVLLGCGAPKSDLAFFKKVVALSKRRKRAWSEGISGP